MQNFVTNRKKVAMLFQVLVNISMGSNYLAQFLDKFL